MGFAIDFTDGLQHYVVHACGGQETALLNIILSCCHMLHVDTISVL